MALQTREGGPKTAPDLLPGEIVTIRTEFEVQAQCLAGRFGISTPRARLVVALLRGEVI